MNSNDLLTVVEAAERWHVKPRTVRKWIALRQIEAVKVGGKCVRIPETEIIRLIREGTMPRLTADNKL